MDNLHIATIAIIVANVLVSLKGFNDTSFFERYKFSVGGIKTGQKERMLSSGFLHVDFSHLIFGGSLLALFFHKDEPYYSAVGASGAVTGVLYAAILLQPNMTLGIMFIPIPLPAYVVGIGYLLYSIYGMKSRVGNIGHTAHFGGAIGGYVTTLLLMPNLLVTDTLMVVLLALPILILFVMQKMGKI